MLTKEEMLEELKKRGVTINLEDRSCGCCGYTTLQVNIDDNLAYIGDCGKNYEETNLNSIDEVKNV